MSRRGRGRGQGNRGRKSGRARGSVGGGSKGGNKGGSKGGSKGGNKGGKRGGQGNNRGGFGRAKGYGPGSGRGFSGAGIGGGKGKGDGKGKNKGGQGNRGKGFGRAKGTVTGKSIRNAIGNLTKGAAAAASTISGKQKQRSKLQQQFANFKKRWQALSTPEAKRERRMRRLYNQHGLDYSRMRDGMTLKINPKQWLSGFERFTARPGDMVPTIRTGWLRDRIPKALSGNWINHTLRSPTKLGARDGWYRGKYNSTGSSVPNSLKHWTARPPTDEPTIGDTRYDGPKDTLSAMYQNILGREIGQEGLDYWTDELESGRQTEDQVRANILRSKEFQGRSEEDKLAVLQGIKQRRAERGEQQGPTPVPGIDWREYRRPRQLPDRYYLPGYPSRGGSGDRFNQAIHHRGGGYRTNRGGKNNKVAKSAAKSIAAHIAAMGGF